ncbi:MAG: hypothetical protein QOJ99_494 [Bryobacterales bacterium]|nr:hypothetical protein [Bryobacterales bacterium]
MDASYRPIGWSRGAIEILSCHRPTIISESQCELPKAVADQIRRCNPADLPSIVAKFSAGKAIYVCRAYFLESQDESLSRPTIALLFERSSSAIDTIQEIAAEFNLTERERQTLEGISMGLSTKELATLMEISPNTVKAFVHLIITKMGVTTRAEVVAEVLAHVGSTSDATMAVGSGAVSVLPPPQIGRKGNRAPRDHTASLDKFGM